MTYQKTSWYNIPQQLDVILANQRSILEQGVHIMSALSDIVTKLQGNFSTLTQEINDNAVASRAEIEALAAAIAASGTVNPDVQAAVDNLTTLNDSVVVASTTLKADTDAMVASLQKPAS